MSKSRVTAADIRPALAAYMAGEDPAAELWRIYDDLAKAMGMDFTDPRYPGGYRQVTGAVSRFNGQVLRALNEMAEAGTLVKRGRQRHLRFVTPERAAKLEKAVQEERESEQLRRDRVLKVKRRLAALGIEVLASHYPVQLPEASWERLLDMAEKGKGSANE